MPSSEEYVPATHRLQEAELFAPAPNRLASQQTYSNDCNRPQPLVCNLLDQTLVALKHSAVYFAAVLPTPQARVI